MNFFFCLAVLTFAAISAANPLGTRQMIGSLGGVSLKPASS